MKTTNVDIQWGNHDILWMGAASGHRACICNVVRICARYNNLDVLENGYGINLIRWQDLHWSVTKMMNVNYSMHLEKWTRVISEKKN